VDDEDNQAPSRSRNCFTLSIDNGGGGICGGSYDIWDNDETEQQQPATLPPSPGIGSLPIENVAPGAGDTFSAGEPEDSTVGPSHVKNGTVSANKTGNGRGGGRGGGGGRGRGGGGGRGRGGRRQKGRKGGGDDDDEGGPGEDANYWLPACPRGGLAVPPAWVASGLGSIDDVQQLPVSGVRAFSSLVASGNSLIESTSMSTSNVDTISSGPLGATSPHQSTSLSTPSNTIETLKAFLSGESWKECQNAFQVNTLENIALRCERAEKVEIGLQFVSMINFIQLSAKVERLAK
jgi:hypothetical protein